MKKDSKNPQKNELQEPQEEPNELQKKLLKVPVMVEEDFKLYKEKKKRFR